LTFGLVLVAILAAIPFAFTYTRRANTTPFTNNVQFMTFAQWKSQENKAYASPAEHHYRMKAFFANIEKIKAVNSDNSLTYTVGLNQFSDLTEEEFIAKYTGFAPVDSTDGIPHVNVGDRQDEINWVTSGNVADVKNQGQCGSCWAFSAIGAVESAWNLAGNKLVTLSEQQLVDCSSAQGNHGCNGGLMNNAFKYIVKAKGVESEKDYPYEAKDLKCRFDVSKVTATIRNYVVIQQNDCDGLLHAVTRQPVSIGIAANAIMSYQSGIFNSPRCGTQLNHGVVTVGYGKDGTQEYWIVRNSWGASWGEKGYIRFARDDNKSEPGMCGICMAASYPVV